MWVDLEKALTKYEKQVEECAYGSASIVRTELPKLNQRALAGRCS